MNTAHVADTLESSTTTGVGVNANVWETTLTGQLDATAMGALKALTDDGLFVGQSREFFAVLTGLAKAADAAKRGS